MIPTLTILAAVLGQPAADGAPQRPAPGATTGPRSVLDPDRRPHPGMDAALVLVEPGLARGDAPTPARPDDRYRRIGRPFRAALGSGLEIAVEQTDEAAAVLGHLGERVRSPTAIGDPHPLALAQNEVRLLDPP